MDGAHPLDIGTSLDQEGVCIRVGQHCVQPIMDHFGIHSTARASFFAYNTMDEIDVMFDVLDRMPKPG